MNGRWPSPLALSLALLVATGARAEDVTVLLSNQDVAITSTYTGTRVTVFGLIERDATSLSRPGRYDVVVTVAGPSSPLAVREKEKIGPLWINSTIQRYADVPGFYALLSTGPLLTIANEAARERQKMGIGQFLENSGLEQDGQVSPAAQALVRLRKRAGLLVEDAKGVSQPRPNLFAAPVPVPAAAPTGRYIVGVTVLADGVPLKTINTSFVVRKIGFEAQVAAAARDHGWLYGLFTITAALLTGFLGNLVLRRD